MSSILEALRKSDNKRQQSQDKVADRIRFSESKTKQKSRKGFFLLVLLLLVVAVGLWAHQAGYLAKIKAMWSAASADDEAMVTNAPQINESVPDAAPVSENDMKLQPPKPDQVKQQLLVKKESSKADGDKPLVKEAGSKDDEIDLKKPSETIKKENQSRLVVDGKKVSAEPEKPSVKPAFTEKPSKQPQQKDRSQDYLLVHQLPFATRQQLPELKINVHVYDPKPENRMVVINGVSFVIGEEVEGVAQVKDITEEGVVIDLAGTVFLIPK